MATAKNISVNIDACAAHQHPVLDQAIDGRDVTTGMDRNSGSVGVVISIFLVIPTALC